MHPGDTIVAIATPPGVGGLGVVRLSGPASREIAARCLRLDQTAWEPRHATLAEVVDESGAPVDQAVVTWFAAPRSYTAEDVVEISCHGAPVVLRFVVERALAAGARLAGPGEFTLRAFLNGRIDLPQAEAVDSLIRATTLYQAKVAARQMEGSLARAIAPTKAQLLELIALLEAGIDFAEDDVSVAGAAELEARLAPIIVSLANYVNSFNYGRLVEEGLSIAIVGRPNVGKSSLFNRLLEQPRAIVTEIPGTTRDTVSERASVGGIPVKFIDTAGLRESAEVVEKMGIERSYAAMAESDITLVVVDASAPLETPDLKLIERAKASGRWLLVANKCDLPCSITTNIKYVLVSALTGQGIVRLRELLIETAAPGGVWAPETGFLTSLRHAGLLKESLEALERAREAVRVGLPHELLLLDCYAALGPIDAMTGATTADDILNRIFSTFCIGK